MTSGGFAGRIAAIDRSQLGALHYLGNYVRRMPTNLPRMMENAYDWEHLPFVHPQAFSSITIAEEGRWGWRAEAGLPAESGGGTQLIELLVDTAQAYWATTVVEGLGQGTQIHTQATDVSGGPDFPDAIEIDVRFYLPRAPQTSEQSAMILGYLQAQYAGLYDQDEALMVGRQEALDIFADNFAGRASPNDPCSVSLGNEADLNRGIVHRVMLAGADYAVRHHAGEWIAHPAVCPHLLGPLADAPIADGLLACPWHGYRFPIGGGQETSGKPCTLGPAAAVSVANGDLYISAPRGPRHDHHTG